MPAVAVAAASEPDPIFAAIDRFNEASALEDGARQAQAEAEVAFQDKYGSPTDGFELARKCTVT